MTHLSAPRPRRIAAIPMMLCLTSTLGGACGSDSSLNDAGGEAPVGGTVSEVEVVAWVRIAPARQESIAQVRRLIGRGVVPDGAGITVSAPFDCRVVALAVAPDDEVGVEALLVQVEPTPSARAELDVARVEADSASDRLDAVRALFARHLTTNDAVLTAEGELEAARARLRALRRSGIEGHGELYAPAAGGVRDLVASQGTWLAGGQPILRLVGRDEVEAVVGLEPGDAPRVTVGQTLLVTAFDGSFGPAQGRVTALGTRVNPTGAVDLHVAVASGGALMADQPVVAELSFPPEAHLVVPHSALVPRDDEFVVFALQDGDTAREVPVTVVFERGERTAVDAPELTDGTPVVVEGNYPLLEGMRVRVRP